jgi:predicted amidohydrolase
MRIGHALSTQRRGDRFGHEPITDVESGQTERFGEGSSDRSPTTSAVVKPDGTLLSYQPYNKEGLLVAEIDLAEATGLLASRYKPAYP